MTEILHYECSDSLAMLAELNRGLDRADQDAAVVVITGRDGMFSGGFDLGTFKPGGQPLYQMLRGGAALVGRIASFPGPAFSLASCPRPTWPTGPASAARRLSTLDARARTATKMLVREPALEAIRAGTASELGSYEVFVETIGKGMKTGSRASVWGRAGVRGGGFC